MEMLEGYGVSHVENVERLKKLSQYAVDGRYAILNDDIDDAEQYVRILRDLLSSAEPQEEGREVEDKERQKEVKQFILGYLPEESRTGEVNTLNFVDSGLLDSFGILTMVMDIESRFSVKLSPEILLKAEAKTVQGLASLVVSEMDND